MKDLKVTNYDNLKDLSLFVKEHERAKKMIQEIDRFYVSFLKSKLICLSNLDQWPGELFSRKEIKTSVIPFDFNAPILTQYWTDPEAKCLNEIYEDLCHERENLSCILDVGDIDLSKYVGMHVELSPNTFAFHASSYLLSGLHSIGATISGARWLWGSSYYYANFDIEFDNPLISYDLAIEYIKHHSRKEQSSYLTRVYSLFPASVTKTLREMCYTKEELKNWRYSSHRDQEFMAMMYSNKELEIKLKREIANGINTSTLKNWKYLKNLVLYQDPTTKCLVPFDIVDDFSKFKFSIEDDLLGHEGQSIVFVSKQDLQNEGLMFDTSNGNFLGYYSY